MLPEGCPMVIGGGIIRDAIMGGVPVDIDVWLPSNVAQNSHDIYDFSRVITDAFPGIRVQHVFEGPRDLNPANDPNNYRDMSNHWVVEFDVGTVKFNVMRTMTQWTGDSAAFFGSVMQNFDIDLCMMFTGAMPTGRGFFAEPVTNIILPSNIVENLQDGRAIDTFCWNRFRYEQTNVARRNFRRDKIISRYGVQEGVVLERAQFIPTPVELTFVLEAQSLLPFPQPPEMADLRTTREAEAQGFRAHGDPEAPGDGDGGWGLTSTADRIRSIDRRIDDYRVRQLGLNRDSAVYQMYDNIIRALVIELADLRRQDQGQVRTGRVTIGRNRGRGIPPINIPADWGVPRMTRPDGAQPDLIPDPDNPGLWVDPRILSDRRAAQLEQVARQRMAIDEARRQMEATAWMQQAQAAIQPMTAEQYRQRVTNNFFTQATAQHAGQATAQRATLNGDLNGAQIHGHAIDAVWVDDAEDLTIGAEMAQNRTPENF
ncbi:hypothetical protein FDJ28_gp24 [Pseudomonas phage Bjorn]|uniref:Poly A polymerase head domain-containing protein n=1 Tax=Pseudomonas phage Bjorn TaxID=2079288 RepID=A0A2K9VHH1_9CAUD|nr:hypothetical protein FDJ28_gp24 [Pseudomonas phage Bjorn]AUV61770.1 hypothetical protein PsPhBjorn_gp46 [Pseudomonas phage Bjorn]